ncbi:hypothetical protein FUAX_18070 [Fulvitalea axinellae]|uniref:SMI1/KNR4 family protein n=1 Tax=Fulvitalea axinellae TaxID=1182444 RepID=A0AAU9DAM5_9BACT|nr:hypothetical protein FUAX_18070 [Fulvitalea axinellae]
MDIKEICKRLLLREPKPDEGYSLTEIEEAERRLGKELPKPLRDFYLMIGKNDLFANAFSRFVRPKSLSEEDGKLIFLEENQSVVYWAVSENGAVYSSENRGGGNWYDEKTDIDTFMKASLYNQCIMADESFHEDYETGFLYSGMLSAIELRDKSLGRKLKTFLDSAWTVVARANDLIVYEKADALMTINLTAKGDAIGEAFCCFRDEREFDDICESFRFFQI